MIAAMKIMIMVTMILIFIIEMIAVIKSDGSDCNDFDIYY